MEFSEKSICEKLSGQFLSSPKYLLNNLYIYQWESDYLGITKSDYAYEIEVKISVQDFKNDFKNKKDKHLLLENCGSKQNPPCPNYFYYATPIDLIKVEDLPDYAGLIYVNDNGHIVIKKKAPKLHNNKFDFERSKLIDKLYYNFVNYKRIYEEVLENYYNIRLKLNESNIPQFTNKEFEYVKSELEATRIHLANTKVDRDFWHSMCRQLVKIAEENKINIDNIKNEIKNG